jgi:hypothetical protein
MAVVYKKNSFLFIALAAICFYSLSCNTTPGQKDKKPILVADSNHKVEIEKGSLYAPVDKSPMDLSYYPPDYPMQKMTGSDSGELIARVFYSRPQKNGREIFVDTTVTTNYIQQYGKEWRLGANEATEIEFFKDVTIKGKKFAKGRYVIYCIPYPDKWTIVFNSNLFSWGLHMDKTKDITQIDLPVTTTDSGTEFFSMIFQKAAYGCDLIMAWGNVQVSMPINF